nr:hypothetical protein [Tanacetum cinerariifolium]
MRRVGKGFSRIETPLFEGMLLEQKIAKEGDAAEHVKEVNVGDPAKGDDSAAHGEVPNVTDEPSIPSPTRPTPLPQAPQDIPSTSQVQQTPPQSPQVQPPSPQPQPQPKVDFPMSLIQEAIDACTALTRRVEHLEYDKVAQALEITKLKMRVKKLEKRNKVRVLKLKRGEEDKKVVDAVKNIEEAKVDESAQVQGRQAEFQAEIYKIDMDHANKLITEVVTAASETVTAASAIITTAKPQVPAATTTTLTVAPVRVVSIPSRRRKGVIIRDPEEESTTSTIIPAETKSKDKATLLAKKVLVVDYEIIEMNNKPYYKIIRADGTQQLYISFLTLPRNFDREDLEALWSLVKERFSTAKPKNFSDDFLLTTLGAMFEKPNPHAKIWKNQRTVHGQAKVKS